MGGFVFGVTTTLCALLVVAMLAFGTFLGVFGSYLGVRRFLHQ